MCGIGDALEIKGTVAASPSRMYALSVWQVYTGAATPLELKPPIIQMPVPLTTVRISEALLYFQEIF